MKVELINIAKTPLVHKKNMVFQRRHGIKAVKDRRGILGQGEKEAE